jgi:hypothetical protein
MAYKDTLTVFLRKLKLLGKQAGVNSNGLYGKICQWGELATTHRA